MHKRILPIVKEEIPEEFMQKTYIISDPYQLQSYGLQDVTIASEANCSGSERQFLRNILYQPA